LEVEVKKKFTMWRIWGYEVPFVFGNLRLLLIVFKLVTILKLSDLQNYQALDRRLVAKAGAEHVQRFVKHFMGLGQFLTALGQDENAEVLASFTPGRIEVLGKHTDYAGGHSLVCAVAHGFFAVCVPSGEATLHLHDVGRSQSLSIDLAHPPEPEIGSWHNFAHSVVKRMTTNFGVLKGGTIAFLNDAPSAAGMSSSSAFIVMLFNLLSSINDLESHPEYKANIHTLMDVATYASTLENGKSFGTLKGEKGVGTLGGSQDHTAILCSQPNQLNLFSYAPTVFHKSVALPENHVFVIAHSGVKADKTGNAMEAYNAASILASEVAAKWREANQSYEPHLAHFLDKSDNVIKKFNAILLEKEERRLLHFVHENQCVLRAVRALEEGNVGEFSAAVQESQHFAETLLQNQVPETAFLARSAVEQGALAASAFGAGFGGSVWALVEAPKVGQFIDAWKSEYAAAFLDVAQQAGYFTETAGAATFFI
jgi:galactokinase